MNHHYFSKTVIAGFVFVLTLYLVSLSHFITKIPITGYLLTPVIFLGAGVAICSFVYFHTSPDDENLFSKKKHKKGEPFWRFFFLDIFYTTLLTILFVYGVKWSYMSYKHVEERYFSIYKPELLEKLKKEEG